MLVHRLTLVSFRLFRKNLGNLREFLGKWFTATEPKNCPQAYVETNILECLYDRTGRQTDALLSILFGRVQLFCSRELPSINIVLHVSFFRYLWLRQGTHVCVLFLSFNIIILTRLALCQSDQSWLLKLRDQRNRTKEKLRENPVLKKTVCSCLVQNRKIACLKRDYALQNCKYIYNMIEKVC